MRSHDVPYSFPYGSRNFSAYITAAAPVVWATPGAVDHPHTRVISGISDTALAPALAAAETVKLVLELAPR